MIITHGKRGKDFRGSKSTAICEKCGTVMVRDLPEGYIGGMSITCPECGWGAASSYYSPIVVDKTDYRIVLLKDNDMVH